MRLVAAALASIPILGAYPLYLLSVPLNWQLAPERVYAAMVLLTALSGAAALLLGLGIFSRFLRNWITRHQQSLTLLFLAVASGNYVLTAVNTLPEVLVDLLSGKPRLVHAIWLLGFGGPWRGLPLIGLAALVFLLSNLWFFRMSPTDRRAFLRNVLGLGLLLAFAPIIQLPAILSAYQDDQRFVVKHPKTPKLLTTAPRRIVLLTFDAWRYRSTSFYDPSKQLQTPNLHSLGTESDVYTQCRAPGDITSISLPSLVSGLYPPQIYGIPANGLFSLRQGSFPTIASFLRRQGYYTSYETVWISPNLMGVGPDFCDGTARQVRLARGALDVNFNASNFISPQPLGRWAQQLFISPFYHEDIEDLHALNQDVIDKFINQKKSRTEPSFTWLHLVTPHATYYDVPDSELRKTAPDVSKFKVDEEALRQRGDMTRLEAAYERTVSVADWQLGRIIEHLKATGEWDETMLIVTSDHGEAHESPERFSHGFGLPIPDVNRVPLVIHFPRQREGMVSHTPVSLVDILPTVLDVCFGIVPEYLPGISLSNGQKFESARRTVFTWAASWDRIARINAHPFCTAVSVYDGRHELLESFTGDGLIELYDRSQSYFNLTQISKFRPGVVSNLQSEIRKNCPPVWPTPNPEFSDPRIHP